jgi:hypothetical protein
LDEATKRALTELTDKRDLLPLLAMPSKAELVDLILQYDLPKRPKLVASAGRK